MEFVLAANNLSKTYQSGPKTLTVLNDVDLRIEPGETCAVVGPSGSGKTTLLGLCAGLDRASAGTIDLCGVRLNDMSEDALSRLRNKEVGFIFQTFQLIPTLTALENVMVPAELKGAVDARPRAEELLEQVGLSDRVSHYPAQLSGGEQQRVAIARAFINRPTILFADEPTGNLDADTGQTIEDLIFELNRTSGTTLMLVTHDHELAARTGRVIKLRGGSVVSDETLVASRSLRSTA